MIGLFETVQLEIRILFIEKHSSIALENKRVWGILGQYAHCAQIAHLLQSVRDGLADEQRYRFGVQSEVHTMWRARANIENELKVE